MAGWEEFKATTGVGGSVSTSGVSTAARRQVSNLFATAKRMYAPGGEYMEGTEDQLRLGQKRSIATGMQNLAASGMAGTSMAGNLGMIYEQDVGQPTRSAANTQRLGALAGLLQAEAGATANLATRYSTSPVFPTSSRGGGTPTRAMSTQRPTTTRQPAAIKLPTLSAFPSLTGAAKKEPTGYQGVYFGKAFYDKQKQAAAPKPTGSFYSDFIAKKNAPSTGLTGLDPYGISSLF